MGQGGVELGGEEGEEEIKEVDAECVCDYFPGLLVICFVSFMCAAEGKTNRYTILARGRCGGRRREAALRYRSIGMWYMVSTDLGMLGIAKRNYASAWIFSGACLVHEQSARVLS